MFSSNNSNKNLLQHILLAVVLLQFCFIFQLIQNGRGGESAGSCHHHILKRSSVQFPLGVGGRECPPGEFNLENAFLK